MGEMFGYLCRAGWLPWLAMGGERILLEAKGKQDHFVGCTHLTPRKRPMIREMRS